MRKLSRDLWDKFVEIYTDPAQPSTSKYASGKGQSDDSVSMPYDAASALFFPKNKPSQKPKQEPAAAASSGAISRESLKKIIVSLLNKANSAGLLSSSDIVKPSSRAAITASNRVKLVNIFISLICTLYNIIESSANCEIHSEHRHLWPSSLANSNRIDSNSLVDLMKTMLSHSLTYIDPYNPSWLRTQADLYMAQTQYSDAMKYHLI